MILVIGDAMIDRYIDGRIRRMAQEAPIPVFEPIGDYRDYPGGAANVAANIEALGEKAVLIAGPQPCPTRKTRYVVGGNLVFRIDEEAQDPKIDPEAIIAAAAEAVQTASAIVVSDYAKGVVPEPVARWAVQAALERGIPLIVDPKPPRLMECWRGATVVKMNEAEARITTGPMQVWAPIMACEKMQETYGYANILLTLGADGMAHLGHRGGGDHEYIPAQAREVFDVVGAGDTVAAALAVGLSRGWGMSRAARFANAAAGVVVGKHGTATATFAEVEAALGASVDP